jgi:tRNA threonylcarbamoyladenosine modification (KEOPS) complex Cgi121 subunit
LLKHIKEFGRHVEIAGFRNVEIVDVKEFLGEIRKEKLSDVEIQFFDAESVATWQHLYFATLNALTAFKNEDNISRSLAMETMLYASAQHQIQKAMKLLGIKPTSSEITALIIGEKPEIIKSALSMISERNNAQTTDTVLKLSMKKVAIIREIFGISDAELKTIMKKNGLEKALVDLVIERMALLATHH